MKKIYLSIIITMLFSLSATGADKMRIVVMNLKAEGIADQTAKTVSNMLRIEFINMGNFTVVERAQMDAIMKEQGLQTSGCTEQACAVQVGRLISARKILVGEVSPMGKSLVMTVRIVDVEKGVSEYAASQKAESEEVLDVAVNQIARKLAERINLAVVSSEGSEKTKPSAEKAENPKEPEGPRVLTPMGYYLRGIVPGWGQCYSGHNTRGWIYAGVFTVAATGALLSIGRYNKTKKKYDNLGSDASDKDFDSKYKDYESAAGGATFFSYFCIAAYLANWVDIVFFSRPEFGAQAAYLDNPGTGGLTFVTFNTGRVSRSYPEKSFDVGLNLRF